MAKKKNIRKIEAKRRQELLDKVERKGKCLRCFKPMIKNHKSCKACNRKDRLRRKANSRGRDKKDIKEWKQ